MPYPNNQLYEKKGNKYVPANDPHAYDGLGNGAWLVVVTGNSKTMRRVIKPKCMELEAALHFLREGLTRAMSKKSELRQREVKLSVKERKAWERYKKTMGDDMPKYFEYPSFWEIAEEGCEYLRKMILENNFDLKKISDKIQNKDDDYINPIRDLEV